MQHNSAATSQFSHLTSPFQLPFVRFEIFFSYPTERTYPIIWNVFEGCTWFNTTFRIAQFWVVNVFAYSANVLHMFYFLIVYHII